MRADAGADTLARTLLMNREAVLNVMTGRQQEIDRTRAFALAIECVTEALWQVPPHTSREQFEATVWRGVEGVDTSGETLREELRQARNGEIRRLLRELSAVKW
ncbi:hypothetical protein [Caldimonas tepidiphila]|uniref:hypothetical protein n=1 Tax=Caldimonas tepidiphila TaxID=2315841 RepID=UPI000E5C56CC|nr:hypothetical protein [Caldimonas tepidiphila]